MAWFSSEDQGSQSDSHVKNGRNHKKKAKIEKEKKREKYDEMNKNVHSWKNRKNAQPVHKNGNTSPPVVLWTCTGLHHHRNALSWLARLADRPKSRWVLTSEALKKSRRVKNDKRLVEKEASLLSQVTKYFVRTNFRSLRMLN